MGSHEDTKMLRQDDLERMARIAVNCGYRIHKDVGLGLLENAYEALMEEALKQAGLVVRRQVPITMTYNGITELRCQFTRITVPNYGAGITVPVY